jgi:hypothetical protein
LFPRISEEINHASLHVNAITGATVKANPHFRANGLSTRSTELFRHFSSFTLAALHTSRSTLISGE